MKKVFLILILFCTYCYASANRIEFGKNIIISQPVYENLYVAGGSVTINAPVYGDLIIGGGTIIINDTVTNDILLVGGEATFNGFVGGDLRCTGGRMRISKDVTGDVVLAGGTVMIEKGITIGALLATSGNITLNGNVNGNITGGFGELVLNGNVGKNLDCRGGSLTINGGIGGTSVLAAGNIVIGNNAAFNNDVRYWNRQGQQDFKQSLKNGRAVYDSSLNINEEKWYFLGAATILGLIWYLGMALVLIMAIEYLFRENMQKAAGNVFNSTLKSLGLGFLFFIVVPVAVVIAFVTVIGVPIGLLLLFIYIALLLLASVITSVVAANWFNSRNNNKWNYWRLVFASFGIFMLLKLVSMIPFAGWICMAAAICIAYGSILLNVRWKSKSSLSS